MFLYVFYINIFLLYRSRIIFTILFGLATNIGHSVLCGRSKSRGKWFHLPSIAVGLVVLGLSLFFACHRVKKQWLRESQKRSDQVEMLLQEMDDALWDEQENARVDLGGQHGSTQLSEPVDTEEQLLQGYSGCSRSFIIFEASQV